MSSASLPIGTGGYGRAEVRGAPEVDPANPLAGRIDMEALTAATAEAARTGGGCAHAHA